MSSLWPRHYPRDREANTPSERKPLSSSVAPKELCGSQTKGIKFQNWRFCISKNTTDERAKAISSQRKARAKVHWAIQNPRMKGRSSLLVGVTPTTLSGT
jgi:hypothetical protein